MAGHISEKSTSIENQHEATDLRGENMKEINETKTGPVIIIQKMTCKKNYQYSGFKIRMFHISIDDTRSNVSDTNCVTFTG